MRTIGESLLELNTCKNNVKDYLLSNDEKLEFTNSAPYDKKIPVYYYPDCIENMGYMGEFDTYTYEMYIQESDFIVPETAIASYVDGSAVRRNQFSTIPLYMAAPESKAVLNPLNKSYNTGYISQNGSGGGYHLFLICKISSVESIKYPGNKIIISSIDFGTLLSGGSNGYLYLWNGSDWILDNTFTGNQEHFIHINNTEAFSGETIEDSYFMIAVEATNNGQVTSAVLNILEYNNNLPEHVEHKWEIVTSNEYRRAMPYEYLRILPNQYWLDRNKIPFNEYQYPATIEDKIEQLEQFGVDMRRIKEASIDDLLLNACTF